MVSAPTCFDTKLPFTESVKIKGRKSSLPIQVLIALIVFIKIHNKIPSALHCPSRHTSHAPAERYLSGSYTSRQMFVYMLLTKHKQLRACPGNGSLSTALVSQYCGFLLVTFVYYRVLTFSCFDNDCEGDQYLDWRVGLC